MAGLARAIALAGALCFAATACGGGGSAANKSTKATGVPGSTTTDLQANERAAVLAAYDDYNRFYDDVVAHPDPSNPALTIHLTGDALQRMRLDQAGFQSTSEGVRFTDESNAPVVISVDSSAGRAVVDDCAAAIAHYFDLATGQPKGAPPLTKPSSEGFEFVFVKDAGVWKVSEKHSKPSACTRP